MKPEVKPTQFFVDQGSTIWKQEEVASPREVASIIRMAQMWANHMEAHASPIPGKKPTSRKAAARMNPEVRDGREEAVYQLLLERNLNDEAAAELLNLPLNSYRPLRNRLVAIGKVKDSGEKTKTKSGREAIAWCAVGPKENPLLQYGKVMDQAINMIGLEVHDAD